MSTADPADAPSAFRHALRTITDTRLRADVALREVPAPARIAPFAVALEASVDAAGEPAGAAGTGSAAPDSTTGRFIVLHDPAGQEAWDGTFRVVTLVRTVMEPEMASDPMLGEVAWTWLEDSLAHCGAAAHAVGGTVTRVVSESFGALAGQVADVELELRSSWSPDSSDMSRHLEAWGALLCTAAGLPPLPAGVSSLRARRGTMGR
ncbi:DUF3000 domain-containing protein [Cellulomonas sp. PhB143]|uniref:DUF3000 domain-containing protein n=1 Tax=Cellulomonas sp. PhB143 TaxID=2485186 RepID=UPI000F477170|nr:DUF3000 domain-containing protein [Cellulomonas sp. PhB143]ROS78970.1 DUF3000 family protein [Cellulomonas sp. PhB143]